MLHSNCVRRIVITTKFGGVSAGMEIGGKEKSIAICIPFT